MGRPKMVQSMDSVYTYTEMQDTIVTHFGLWVRLVDECGPKTKRYN